MVADGLVSLSCESGQVWFVTGAPNVTPRRAELSHADRPALPEALGVLSPADGGGLGAAGYIRRAKETETAEVAVTVLDKWQRRRLAPSWRAGCLVVPAGRASAASRRWSTIRLQRA